MIKTVIFDMDGVIINSEPIHQRTEIQALETFGLTVTTQDLHPYVGATRQAFKAGLAQQFPLPIKWDAMFELKDELFYQQIVEVETIPGVLPLLHELKQDSFQLGLATSAPKRLLTFVLNKFSLEPIFDSVVCAHDITHSKPDPEIFLKAARQINVDQKECAVVEDSINGIRAAKAAGMTAIAITTTFPREAFDEADHIIESHSQINASFFRFLHPQ